MVTIDTNISTIRRNLQNMQKKIKGDFEAGLGILMYEALLDLKSKTPVDTGKLRDGWILKTIGGGSKGRVSYRPILYVIYNKATHSVKGEPLKRALLDGKDYTLLEVMEYGSSAHVIVPKNKKFLQFQIGGEWIRTDKVEHPGTRPYSMIRLADEKLRKKINRYVSDFAKQLIDIWEKKK